MMTDEQLMDFFIQIVAIFLGAGLAFLANRLHYKGQKREENITTLDFLRASLAHVLNESFTLKEQIVQHRYKEVMDFEKTLEEKRLDYHFKPKHILNGIFFVDFEWPIAQEKLGFLASPDPNLIILVGATKRVILTLNTIVHDINADIVGYRKGEEQLGDNAIRLIIDKNKILLGQIDDVLYFTKKLSDVLNKFGHMTYGKDMKKMEFQLTEEKYNSLLPKPIESWEGYEWFPQKKKWWQSKTERTTQ